MILGATINFSEEDYAWTGTMELGDPADYYRIRINDPIEIKMAGETFAMVVDNKTITREGVDRGRLTVSLISPTTRFAVPHAVPITKTWDVPVMAQAASEEVVGEPIEWDLVNWLIPAGRLAVYNAAPIDIVRTIASAAGGLVETTPSGSLRVRHRFPVPVPQWQEVEPSHVLTDASHNLSCRESYRLTNRCDKVVVRGYLPSSSYLAVAVDSRSGGANLGRTQFSAGDSVDLLVGYGPETKVQTVNASAGTLTENAIQFYPVTEDIVFDGGRTASLSQPARSIQSVIWIGYYHGELSLLRDGRTVQASHECVAVARVSYTVLAKSWRLTTQKIAGGLSAYPVHVQVTGTIGDPGQDGEIVCQRGSGQYQGNTISDPLLATTEAKISRGRAEIDAGEDLQAVTLVCVYRPSVMPGQIVEVHNAIMGQSWRGKITGITHDAQGLRVTTSLEIVRVYPAE